MPWSPSQYVKFEDERTRPARDLLAQVPLDSLRRAVDLGCGPGNSTALIVERFGPEGVSGLDSDVNMLAAARQRLPGIPFLEADLATWVPAEPVDLFFANAVFQWVPNHLDVFDRLLDGLAPGGVLAIQMPDNLMEPSHRLMEETAHDGPWRDLFRKNPALRAPLPPPSTYYDRLKPKAARLDLWHSIYSHVLDDAAAIVEWVKGTGLRRYLDTVGPEQHAAFTAAYLDRVAKVYRPLADGRVLFRFPRFFLVAVKHM